MEGFYSNTPPRPSRSRASSHDPKCDHQSFIRRAPYPLMSSSYNSYPSDRLDMDPSLIKYSRTAAAVAARAAAAGIIPSTGDMFLSSGMDTGMLHPALFQQYHYGSLSSLGSPSYPPSAVQYSETPPSRAPPVFETAVKVQEDVLVMDGILVNSSSGRRTRSVIDSSASSTPKNLYKTEICRAWEESGSCRYGSKCQFAHGKDELRQNRHSNKNKIEKIQICEAFITGRCAYGSSCRFLHQVAALEPEAGAAASSVGKQGERNSSSRSKSCLISEDWCPLDDGIEVCLPSSTDPNPSREAVNTYISDILYGPHRTRRLPLFANYFLPN